MPQNILNDDEIVSLKKLHSKNYFSPEEVADLQAIFVRSIGSMQVNKAMSLISLDGQHADLSSHTVNFIRDLSYRTRHMERIKPNFDSIWSDFDRVMTGETQYPIDKISIEEYGILYDLSAFFSSIHDEYERGLIEDSQELEELYEYTKKAHIIITYLDEKFAREFTFPTGSVVVTDFSKTDRIYGENTTSVEKFYNFLLTFCITKYGHAAKGISVPREGELLNKISHINPEYKEENFSLRNFLYSEVYRIKLDALIDEHSKVILKDNYGEDWLIKLEKQFSDIERTLHDQARDKYVDKLVIISPEVATSLATIKLQGGHKNWFTKEHSNEDIRDQIFQRGLWANQTKYSPPSMLCSEFIGMTIIAAIQELNDVIKAELHEKGVSDIPVKMIKSPISKREKLTLLTPERLISAMESRGALQHVGDSASIEKCITKDLKSRLQTIKIGKGDEDAVSEDSFTPS